MRLTCILSKHYKRISGLMYSGKKGLVKPITIARKAQAVKLMLNDARNKVILDKPYLTQAENQGAMKALKPNHSGFIQMIDNNAIKRWQKRKPDRTIEEHLEHLNLNRKWE